MCGWICFIKLGKFLAMISSNILSAPYSPLLLGHWEYIFWCVSWSSTDLFIFLHSFFFLSSDWKISVDLSSAILILSSACSNLWLSPSSKFFISIITLFKCRISFCFFFSSLSPYWYSLCGETSFSYFHLVLYTWFPLVLEHILNKRFKILI